MFFGGGGNGFRWRNVRIDVYFFGGFCESSFNFLFRTALLRWLVGASA